MNTQEFKAWFEGFTEAMEGKPTAAQWKRIKERVGEITAEPTTVRYWYDHYWRPYYIGGAYVAPPIPYMQNTVTYTGSTTGDTLQAYCSNAVENPATMQTLFGALGAADYMSSTAQ